MYKASGPKIANIYFSHKLLHLAIYENVLSTWHYIHTANSMDAKARLDSFRNNRLFSSPEKAAFLVELKP
jgi:hypothetical protein